MNRKTECHNAALQVVRFIFYFFLRARKAALLGKKIFFGGGNALEVAVSAYVCTFLLLIQMWALMFVFLN